MTFMISNFLEKPRDQNRFQEVVDRRSFATFRHEADVSQKVCGIRKPCQSKMSQNESTG